MGAAPMSIVKPQLKDDAYHVLIFSQRAEARRFANHFITKGYWFSCQSREGETYICVASSHYLTRLHSRFQFEWEGAWGGKP